MQGKEGCENACMENTPFHGQTIRYLTGPLGVVTGTGDEAVNQGDYGRYLGPAPDDGWHFTEAANYPGKITPVSLDMIEAA